MDRREQGLVQCVAGPSDLMSGPQFEGTLFPGHEPFPPGRRPSLLVPTFGALGQLWKSRDLLRGIPPKDARHSRKVPAANRREASSGARSVVYDSRGLIDSVRGQVGIY
jgi:hypothetical protein